MTAGDAARSGRHAGRPRGLAQREGRLDRPASSPRKLASAYNQAIRADKAWAAGYTGKGVGVAVIDSGLAGDLPDFRGTDGTSAASSPPS